MQHFHIAIVLIWRNNQILVQRRLSSAEHLPNVWEFPGGKCEEGETPREAAIREAREELGVEIEIFKERRAEEHDYSKRDKSKPRVTLYSFDAKIAGDTEPQALASSKLRWMHPNEMRVEEFPAANFWLIADLQNTTNEIRRTKRRERFEIYDKNLKPKREA